MCGVYRWHVHSRTRQPCLSAVPVRCYMRWAWRRDEPCGVLRRHIHVHVASRRSHRNNHDTVNASVPVELLWLVVGEWRGTVAPSLLSESDGCTVRSVPCRMECNCGLIGVCT